jgi:hypothetical protein
MASIVVQYNKDPRGDKKRAYAYLVVSRWNSVKKMPVPERTFLGAVTEKGEVVFSRGITGLSEVVLPLEKVKEMAAAGESPVAWAQAQSQRPPLALRHSAASDAKAAAEAATAPAPVAQKPADGAALIPVAGAKVQSIGAVKIYRRLAEDSGLLRCLSAAFGEADADILLTLATFLGSEGQAWMHCQDWIDGVAGLPAASARFDFGSRSLSRFIAELGGNIDGRELFFPAWTKAQGQLDSVLIDTTSYSTHSKSLSDAEWGKNRDGDLLPQINVQCAASAAAAMPLAYRRLPGSVPDVATLTTSLHSFKEWGIGSAIAVLDRGFFSRANLERMIAAKQDFIVAVPIGNAQARDLMKHHRRALASAKNAFQLEDDVVSGVALDWAVDPGKPAEGANRVHGILLRNAKVKAEREEALLKTVFELESKSRDEIFRTPEEAVAWLEISAPGYKKLLKPEQAGAAWILKRKPNVLAAWCESFGQQIILSSRLMPVQALAEAYRLRGTVEQIFDTPKNDLHQKRNRSGNDDVVDGHLFLSFLAVILRRLLALKLAGSAETKVLPLTRVQNLIRRIQVHISRNGSTFAYDITKAQRLIIQAVGAEITV